MREKPESPIRASRPVAGLVLLLVVATAGCGGTPDRGPGRGGPDGGGPRFVDGPEFRQASEYQARAIEQHRLAFIEEDLEERDALLRQAYQSCIDAQEEYQDAMGRYPYHQREAIEFQMAAVHDLMLEIQRDLQ